MKESEQTQYRCSCTRLADEAYWGGVQVLQEAMSAKNQRVLSGEELYNRYHSSKTGRKEQ